LTSSSFAQTKPQSLPAKSFRVCDQAFSLEVADKPESRRIGLMNRTEVPVGKGMLFVFTSEEVQTFWMKNVPFDIDIAFFDRRGHFVSATLMKGTSPLQREDKLPVYESKGPAIFVVEARAGALTKLASKGCRLDPLPTPASL